MAKIWSSETKWCRELHSGVNCVITVLMRFGKPTRSTFVDELGVSKGGLPLQCEFAGLEMLHLPLQLGCICNAVVSTVKIALHTPGSGYPLCLHSLTKQNSLSHIYVFIVKRHFHCQ